MDHWRFFGRRTELTELRRLIERRRWFFLQISGRRRIGKTTLVKQALEDPDRPGQLRRDVLRVEIPDSGEAGVLSAVADAMEAFRIPMDDFPEPRTMAEFAGTVEALARAGYIVVLDEFRISAGKRTPAFCSHLQYAADRLAADGRGGHRGADRPRLAPRGDGRPAGGPGGPAVRPSDRFSFAVRTSMSGVSWNCWGRTGPRRRTGCCSCGPCSRGSRSIIATPTSGAFCGTRTAASCWRRCSSKAPPRCLERRIPGSCGNCTAATI